MPGVLWCSLAGPDRGCPGTAGLTQTWPGRAADSAGGGAPGEELPCSCPAGAARLQGPAPPCGRCTRAGAAGAPAPCPRSFSPGTPVRKTVVGRAQGVQTGLARAALLTHRQACSARAIRGQCCRDALLQSLCVPCSGKVRQPCRPMTARPQGDYFAPAGSAQLAQTSAGQQATLHRVRQQAVEGQPTAPQHDPSAAADGQPGTWTCSARGWTPLGSAHEPAVPAAP